MTDQRSASATKVLVFVPTFNDTELLGEIVVAVKRLSDRYTVLVLDDGSDVGRRPAIGNLDCLCFRLPDNMGLGTCTQIAFDHVLRHDYQAVVRVDADGQHPLERIPELLAPLEEGRADVVAGRRVNHNVGSGGGAVARRMVKSYFVTVAKALTGGAAPNDVNTGFFAMNRHAVATLNQHTLERFPEPQLFILACREKLRVMELPIEQVEREFGASTLNFGQAAAMLYRFNMFVLGELLQGSRR